MANEISLQITLTATKNGITFEQALSQVKNMAGDEMALSVQVVGTSSEPLFKGDISQCGLVLLKNLDSTNLVHIESDGSGYGQLLPGEFMVVRADTGATPSAFFETAAGRLLVFALEP